MSELLQWEDNMIGNIRLVGLTPLSINGDIHFATQIKLDHNYDMQNVSSSSSLSTSKMVTSSSINGEMLLFSQPSFPDIFDQTQMPNLSEIDLKAGDKLIRIENVLFGQFRQLSGYNKCDAAEVEFVAESMSMSEVTKTINTKVTI